MTRVLGVLAALLWVAGIVVLVVGVGQLSPDLQVAHFTSADQMASYRDTFAYNGRDTKHLLYVGIGLVGVAGLLTAGAVLVGRRR